MQNTKGVSNIRNIIKFTLNHNGEDSLITYVFDNPEKMNNSNVCYSGRLPKYDNEAAVSGKFASDYGFDIGDEIELEYGSENYKFLLTGLIQTCNNSGMECVITQTGAAHLMDLTYSPAYFWFDCDENVQVDQVLDLCTEKYSDHVVSTMNFHEMLEGNMTTFKSIASLMLVMLCIISAIVIVIILYLLIRSFVYNKRRDYGVYKALGFTSKSLILQTALSFMPSIIISSVVFSVFSYYMANPYMSVVMHSFGLMKSTFIVPVPGVILIGISMIVIAFFFSLLQSLRIKEIECYEMLIGE